VYAAILQCLDPLLTVAAAASYCRGVFLSPPDARAEANEARRKIAGPYAAYKSDHLAVVSAYNEYRTVTRDSGEKAARTWCRSSFISDEDMRAMHKGRSELASALVEVGFVSPRASLLQSPPSLGTKAFRLGSSVKPI
jgi:HrpA-like RNA helicase